jgi:hypothetical protein
MFMPAGEYANMSENTLDILRRGAAQELFSGSELLFMEST